MEEEVEIESKPSLSKSFDFGHIKHIPQMRRTCFPRGPLPSPCPRRHRRSSRSWLIGNCQPLNLRKKSLWRRCRHANLCKCTFIGIINMSSFSGRRPREEGGVGFFPAQGSNHVVQALGTTDDLRPVRDVRLGISPLLERRGQIWLPTKRRGLKHGPG